VKSQRTTLFGRLRRRSLVKDRSGATAVEFAMVGGPFIILMMVLLDVGMALWTKVALQSALTETQRLVRTGQSAAMKQADLKATLCKNFQQLGRFVKCNELFLDVRTFDTGTRTFATETPSLDNLSQFKFAYDPQQRGSIVLLRGFAVYDVITPGVAALISPSAGKILLQASELVWVEP
jgi:Flp pilus assembly protein TadG